MAGREGSRASFSQGRHQLFYVSRYPLDGRTLRRRIPLSTLASKPRSIGRVRTSIASRGVVSDLLGRITREPDLRQARLRDLGARIWSYVQRAAATGQRSGTGHVLGTCSSFHATGFSSVGRTRASVSCRWRCASRRRRSSIRCIRPGSQIPIRRSSSPGIPYRSSSTHCAASARRRPRPQVRGYILQLHDFAGINSFYDFRSGNGGTSCRSARPAVSRSSAPEPGGHLPRLSTARSRLFWKTA